MGRRRLASSRRATIPDDDLSIASMKDHILASGEVVGLGARDPTAPPPAPKPAERALRDGATEILTR
jgi:hypothetical protein